MSTNYPNFDLCLEAKELGFPQARKSGAMYYVRPDMLISIEDLTYLRKDGYTDFEDIFNTLVFKPRLDDLSEASRSFFHELIRLPAEEEMDEEGVKHIAAPESFFAYSNVEDTQVSAEMEEGTTKRADKFIRERGKTEWEARLKLFVHVKRQEKELSPPFDSETSDNQVKSVDI